MSCSAGNCGCPAPIASAEARLTTTITDTLAPSAAWNGTHVGVVYLEDTGPVGGNITEANLYFALLNPDGTRAVSPDLALTNLSFFETVSHPPDIVWNGSEFAVAWSQTNFQGVATIMFQRIAADGTPKDASVDLSANTPGSKIPAGSVRIQWSPVNAGYAIVVHANSYPYGEYFQLIGADGSSPAPVNQVGTNDSTRPGFAVAPTGEWATAEAAGTTYLSLFNPDGSKTQPSVHLGTSASTNGAVDLTHDGATWLTAWKEGSNIYVNRGDTKNTPFVAATFSSSGFTHLVDVSLSGTGALALMWSQPNEIYLRRFLIPTTTSSTLTALTPTIGVLTSPTASGGITAVHTGSGSLLAIWADTRWGAGELYARSFDFSSCP